MQAGALVAGRFRIEREAGGGGMGMVYRARDEQTGSWVAIKTLREDVPDGHERFSREVSALARMSHPAIVKYVAHGDAPHFVAMEWLEGKDLGKRLREDGPLPIPEAIELAARIADAVDHAHALGIVHRDIKPSNIFFEHDEISRARVVDFGLAWIAGDLGFQSTAGVLLGTPGYMAPEQVRGEPIDARADVFAIACLLYKCLTGRGPFTADDAVATLAKVLFHEPDPASSLRRGVPRALDGILACAMSKERGKRPATARALANQLRALERDDEPSAPPAPSSTTLTDRERRIVSVVVAAREGLGEDVSTLRASPEAMFVERQATLRAIAEKHGARLEILPVAIVAVLDGQGSATDRAAAAGRLALALRDALSGVPIALATGHAELGARAMGDVIDRAVAAVTAKNRVANAVAIDDTTAGLLGPTFVVQASAAGLALEAERAETMQVRTLLGKPTPCVGRDRELAFLDATLAECESDDVARCVLVTGPAGVGKSRLRYEWLRKIESRNVEVWTARADPMTAGAPFSLLAQVVRRAAGVDASESNETVRARLTARLALTMPADKLAHAAEFLGEVVGARFSDDGRVQLRAARQDALLMSDQVRRAWEDWVGAEAKTRPLVIVLEDLHWGDLPTVQLVDYALGTHGDLPIMVLALARPNVKDVFPSLWQKRHVLELPLGELTPKASARLARHVLEGVDAATIDRVVASAAGNAFFLEEILRAVAEGRGDDVPETVLAMVQRRLDALPAEARRVLRAASVFGEMFWKGAVEESGPLEDLVQRELVTRRSSSRFAGEEELTFRHAIVRDAAYAMLTDDDRALGHRLAGAWLEQRGERDAAVLAQHFDRGGDPARAVPHYVRAVVQALEGNDLERVIALAERGATVGASGADLGELRRAQAEALRWRGRIAESETAAREATELLPEARQSWYAAIGELGTVAGTLAHAGDLHAALDKLFARGDASSPDFATALARITMQLYASGQRDRAHEALARLDALDVSKASPNALARIVQARAFRALYESDHGTYYERMKEARALFDAAGDRRNACVQSVNMGYVAIALGALDEAEQELVPVVRTAEMLGILRIRAIFQQNIGFLRLSQGRYDEAIAFEEQSAPVFEQQGDPRLATFSLVYMAMAYAKKGDLVRAHEIATRAVKLSEPQLPAHSSALAHLAEIELARGEIAAALEHARAAYAILEKLGGLEDTESSVRIIYCEALVAAGRTEDAKPALRAAVAAIESRAEKIKVPRFRESFVRTPENVRTFDLAAKLLG
jgi:tetratricopeptide (TPR) repeat protein